MARPCGRRFRLALFDVGEILTSDRIDGFLTRVRALGILIVIRSYRVWRMLTLVVWSNRGVVWNRNTPVSVAKE